MFSPLLTVYCDKASGRRGRETVPKDLVLPVRHHEYVARSPAFETVTCASSSNWLKETMPELRTHEALRFG